MKWGINLGLSHYPLPGRKYFLYQLYRNHVTLDCFGTQQKEKELQHGRTDFGNFIVTS